MISEGNVKIVFDNKTKTAVADKAVYLADQKVLELSGGDPKVWSGKNVVRGKKITLFRAENRSLVEGAGEDQVEAILYVKEGGGLTK
jgi:lipopolysaccharide export system protein LptA